MYLNQYREDSGITDFKDISIAILVVNDDLACQNKVAELLRSHIYQVLHTGNVYDTLHAIWENKERIDLVITNAQKLGAEGLAIIDNLKQKLKVNVMFMRSGERIERKGQLFSFSVYVFNGLSIYDVNNLLDDAKLKKVDRMVSASISDAAVETNKVSSTTDAAERLNQQRKAVELYEERSENSKDDDHKEKKQRVTWTQEMHEKFKDAIERLGYDKAVPKKIVEVMGVPGLTRENVASHLQKHRCTMRRTQETDFGSLPCRSTGIELGSLGVLTSHSASRLASFRTNMSAFPQSSYIPTIKDERKDLSFDFRSERKFCTSPHLRNMMQCRNKYTSSYSSNQSDTGNFAGTRFIGNSIGLGPIDKINPNTLFSSPGRSENHSTSYVRHHNPIGSASYIPQQSSLLQYAAGDSSFQWQPLSRIHGTETAAVNTSNMLSSSSTSYTTPMIENILQYPQQQTSVQQPGDCSDALHDQNLQQSWDTPPASANAALFHNPSENTSTASSMFPPPHQDIPLPPLETPGNGFAEQISVAFVDDILQQHCSPPPLPEMLQNLDEFFYQSGIDDPPIIGLGNTCDQFDLPEFDDTFFSQDD